MPSSHDLDAKFELLQADDYSQYLLRDKREVAFVLRQLAAKRNMITAYFGPQNDFLLTSVVGVSADDRDLLLDLGAEDAHVTTALAAKQLVCVTQLDKIKVQFLLDRVERTQFEGFPALRAALPTELLRLQRREYYRLTTPSSDGLVCEIRLPSGELIETRVVDISGGGIAVVAPPHGLVVAPEMQFDSARLFLPDGQTISVALRIRNVFRMTSLAGTETIRAGCQFLNLPAQLANTIQRYILKVERERNSRSKL